ncbi:MAG: anti-sigma factor, partial [Ignavibacteria bacterium]|nr:anti-sigma factor [Ignavibacteria bacterium]
QRPQRTTQISSQTSPVQHKNLFQRIETPEQKLFSQISSPNSEDESNYPEPIPEAIEPIKNDIKRTEEFEPVSSDQNDYSFKPEKDTSTLSDFTSPFSKDESPQKDESYSGYSSYSPENNDESFSSNFDQIESGSKDTSDDKDEFSFESSLSNYSLSGESTKKSNEAFSSFTSETMIEEPAADSQKEAPVVEKVKSGISSGIFFLAFLGLVGAIAGVYYFLSKDFKVATEKQATEYKAIVQSLQRDLSSSKEIDALLASVNLQMGNLKSTPIAAGAYGKILFDTVTRKAMIQLVNLPVLSSDKVYQLWVISNNQKYSAGVYNVTSSMQYFPITNFSGLNLIGLTSFLITEEVSTGGEKPSKDVYLAGQIVF